MCHTTRTINCTRTEFTTFILSIDTREGLVTTQSRVQKERRVGRSEQANCAHRAAKP